MARSLLAFWIGGACTPPPARGPRSMLAFWMGGAVSDGSPSGPVGGGSSGGGGGLPWRRMPIRVDRRLNEDEEILIVIAAFLQAVD